MVLPRSLSASTQALCRKARRLCNSAARHSTLAFNKKRRSKS